MWHMTCVQYYPYLYDGAYETVSVHMRLGYDKEPNTMNWAGALWKCVARCISILQHRRSQVCLP